MKIAIVLPLLLFFVAVVTASAAAAPVEIVDDLGQKIVLTKPAERIIPLYGAFAEMLFSIGAGNTVIARTRADTSPPELAVLPSVGTHMNPNMEMITGLKPDLVVMSASRREETPEISRLAESGTPVAVFSPKSFEEIFSVMKRLGAITGHASEAAASAAAMSARLAVVRTIIAGIESKPKVFFEVRAEPLTAAGRGSIVNEILKSAGAENTVEDEKAIVQYSLEALLAKAPDFYVVQRGPMNMNPVPPGERAHFDRLKCVRDSRIMIADEFMYSRPGPRCVDAVEQLAAALYPERFPNSKGKMEE